MFNQSSASGVDTVSILRSQQPNQFIHGGDQVDHIVQHAAISNDLRHYLVERDFTAVRCENFLHVLCTNACFGGDAFDKICAADAVWKCVDTKAVPVAVSKRPHDRTVSPPVEPSSLSLVARHHLDHQYGRRTFAAPSFVLSDGGPGWPEHWTVMADA